jgi:hypothetical protein
VESPLLRGPVGHRGSVVATEPNDLLDERAELIKTARRQLATVNQAVANMTATLDALAGERREYPKEDENGEPTFVYQVKVPIPKDIFQTKKMKAYAAKHGFNEFETARMWQDFVGHYLKSRVKWAHWSRVWFDWVRRQREKAAQGSGGEATRFDRSRTRG